MAEESSSLSVGEDAFVAYQREEPDSDDGQVAGPSAKRPKLSDSESAVPASVLSLRGLPGDVTESEVAVIASQFGPVSNIILTRNKHKALVEMTRLDNAKTMVDYYSKNRLLVRSCDVSVNYSKHTELKMKLGEQSVSLDSSRRVLHIIVDNMVIPLCLEVLADVFFKFGEVMKIVTFNRNETFHVLVQYADGESARKAKQSLNGQNLYANCDRLFIEYSKVKDLVVKCNSDISRDYTNPDIPVRTSPTIKDITTQDKDSLVSDVPDIRPAAENDNKRGLLPYPKPKVAVTLEFNQSSRDLPSQFLPPAVSVMTVTNPFYAGKVDKVDAAPVAAVDLEKKVAWSERRPVVLVSNLDEGRVTVDALFTLFGVYGDVIRVKICCNTKSKALIQYKDYKFARDAIANLDGINLWGRQIKLAISKYRIVQMPKEGAHNVELTRDYTTSRWHRFHNGDRAQAPIVPPSRTLFLANIPPKVTDTKLKRLFNACGTVTDFKFFEPSNLFRLQQAVQIHQLPPNSNQTKAKILNSPPDRRMALIELSTVDEAIDALMTLHNKQFPGTNRYLCVSFTKSVIEHRDATP